jgi:ElaB/YqjD/DUF883 family membrane-anchored ribosome-binding protein
MIQPEPAGGVDWGWVQESAYNEGVKAMPETSNPDTTGNIEEQIKTIREDISRLTQLFVQLGQDNLSGAGKAARDEADELLNRTRQAADEVAGRAKQAAGSMESYIVEKPFQSAIVALLVGIFIGFLSRR